MSVMNATLRLFNESDSSFGYGQSDSSFNYSQSDSSYNYSESDNSFNLSDNSNGTFDNDTSEVRLISIYNGVKKARIRHQCRKTTV